MATNMLHLMEKGTMEVEELIEIQRQQLAVLKELLALFQSHYSVADSPAQVPVDAATLTGNGVGLADISGTQVNDNDASGCNGNHAIDKERFQVESRIFNASDGRGEKASNPTMARERGQIATKAATENGSIRVDGVDHVKDCTGTYREDRSVHQSVTLVPNCCDAGEVTGRTKLFQLKRIFEKMTNKKNDMPKIYRFGINSSASQIHAENSSFENKVAEAPIQSSSKKKRKKTKRKGSRISKDSSMIKSNKLEFACGTNVTKVASLLLLSVSLFVSIALGQQRGSSKIFSSPGVRKFVDRDADVKLKKLKRITEMTKNEASAENFADNRNEFSSRKLQPDGNNLAPPPTFYPTYRLQITNWPTFSPISKPTISPTLSSIPSNLPSSSNGPTISSIPSNLPSSTSSPSTSLSPTPMCKTLTVAIFLPPISFTGSTNDYSWKITTIEDGTELGGSWGFDGGDGGLVFYDINGTNFDNNKLCLWEETYEITIENLWGAVWFALFLDDRRIKCGIVLDSSEPSVHFEIGSENTGCSTSQGDPFEQEFEALQCYWGAIAPGYYLADIDRDYWFDEKCGGVLARVCSLQNSSLGFDNETASMEFSDFCAYQQCAYTPFGERLVDDVNSCECLFLHWWCNNMDQDGSCNRGQLKESFECCQSGASSCECIIKPQCEGGDDESCSVFEEHCCNIQDGSCDCNTVKDLCIKSIQIGSDQFCDHVDSVCCNHSSDCQCDVWEPMCTDYQGHACKRAADSCCLGDYVFSLARNLQSGISFTFREPDCFCDFSHYAIEILEYEFDNIEYYRDWPCSQAREQESDPAKEKAALEQIYEELGGNFWHNNSGWKTADNHCEWYGVTCLNGHVHQLDLNSNNLTGSYLGFDVGCDFEYDYIPVLLFSKLQSLSLANNSLSGTISYYEFFRCRDLKSIDISQNDFSGEAEALISPSAIFVNISHNNFTSINSFKSFKRSFATLRTFDASNNNIRQNATQILFNMPINLEELFLSNNLIEGNLPDSLEGLEGMRVFHMSNNYLVGSVPDLQRAFPNLRILDLSNQASLTGHIPTGIFNLVDLTNLNLSHNDLSGIIPPEISKSTQLKTIAFASNNLRGTIPSELGKLADVVEEFDVSNNVISGIIPSALGGFKDALVKLSDNPDIIDPAPLSLCFVDGFDLKKDSRKCPVERNALNEFFDSTKGQEWTNGLLWKDEYRSPCSWYGVSCDEANSSVTNLTLSNNGLSGKLSDSIHYLASLEVLDLGNNDIKGSIPPELGSMSNLTYLRLSYNAFDGQVPSTFEYLTHLELVQLHGNRLLGAMPILNGKFSDPFSLIADCGVPSDFDQTLYCSQCTMCCNSREDCYPNTKNWVQEDFDSYMRFTWAFFVGLFGFCVLFGVLSYLFYAYKATADSRRLSTIEREKKAYALTKLGEESVYRFFLSNSLPGWIIALTVMGIQIWVLYAFVRGAEHNLNDDYSDLVYTWKCPRDGDECKDEADLGISGWIIFGILMVSHLLKDIINGLKLMRLCMKDRHSSVFTSHTRMRFLSGGMLLTLITSFTLFVSTIYNKAIATSNTEIIINAVVILFVTDLDEQFFELCKAVNPTWLHSLTKQQELEFRAHDELRGFSDDEICAEIQKMKQEIVILRDTTGMLTQHYNKSISSAYDSQSSATNRISL